MELDLYRTYLPQGTNGSLMHNGKWLCHTIELPWAHNKTSVSCIPEGRYLLRERRSERYGRHLVLYKVPQRNLILIHAANNAKRELRGCIAPVVKLTGPGRWGAAIRTGPETIGAIGIPGLGTERTGIS